MLPKKNFLGDIKHVGAEKFFIGYRVISALKTILRFRTIRILNQLSTRRFFLAKPLWRVSRFRWKLWCKFPKIKLWRNMNSNIVMIHWQLGFSDVLARCEVGEETETKNFANEISIQVQKFGLTNSFKIWNTLKVELIWIDKSRLKALLDFWDYSVFDAGLKTKHFFNEAYSLRKYHLIEKFVRELKPAVTAIYDSEKRDNSATIKFFGFRTIINLVQLTKWMIIWTTPSPKAWKFCVGRWLKKSETKHFGRKMALNMEMNKKNSRTWSDWSIRIQMQKRSKI